MPSSAYSARVRLRPGEPGPDPLPENSLERLLDRVKLNWMRAAGGDAADAGLAEDRGGSPGDGRAVDQLRRALEKVSRFGRWLDVGPDDRGMGIVSKGEPTGPVPERGKQGEDVGLGDLDDPDNLAQQILNPPEGGWQGAQQQELIRAMARRVKNPAVAAEGARGEQTELERSRRMVRRNEAQNKLDAAEGPTQTADAVADADDAARTGEITRTDADGIRGRAAKKLQSQKGQDGPPAPGEIDAQAEQSRARRGTKAPAEKKPEEPKAPKDLARSGVTTLPEGVRAVTDKTPIRFPERAPDGRPNWEQQPLAGTGAPAIVEGRVVQPGEGESARQTLPGFEDIVPQIRALTRVTDPEPIAREVGVEGTAAEIPVREGEPVPVAPETAVVAGGRVAPGTQRQPLPGMTRDVREAQATRAGPETAAERREREAREGPIAARAQEEATGRNVRALGEQFEGTAEDFPVRRPLARPLEPGQIVPAEPAGTTARQELPGLERTPGEGALRPAGGETAAERLDREAREAEVRAAQVQELGERPLGTPESREPSPLNLALTDLTKQSARRLVDERGNVLTKEQIVTSVLGDLTQIGGRRALLDELDTWGDGLKGLVAGARGVRVTPKEIERAMAAVGEGAKRAAGRGAKPTWETLSQRQKEGITDFRWEHLFDVFGTYQRMNLLVNPESFARNLYSTTVGLPFRFTEATFGPAFERAWGTLPRFQEEKLVRDAKGRTSTTKGRAEESAPLEAVAMAEGLYRSLGRRLANGMNVLRRGDPEALTSARWATPRRGTSRTPTWARRWARSSGP